MDQKWIKKVCAVNSTQERAREITAHRFFDAMMQTADEFDLGIGRRFPAAEICACAQLLEYNGTVPTRRLAEELFTLIFDVWWTSLCWPREYMILAIWRSSRCAYGAEYTSRQSATSGAPPP